LAFSRYWCLFTNSLNLASSLKSEKSIPLSLSHLLFSSQALQYWWSRYSVLISALYSGIICLLFMILYLFSHTLYSSYNSLKNLNRSFMLYYPTRTRFPRTFNEMMKIMAHPVVCRVALGVAGSSKVNTATQEAKMQNSLTTSIWVSLNFLNG
jgi:hypothetical protein